MHNRQTQTEQLADMLRDAEVAHKLSGDSDWPLWFAAYLINHGVSYTDGKTQQTIAQNHGVAWGQFSDTSEGPAVHADDAMLARWADDGGQVGYL